MEIYLDDDTDEDRLIALARRSGHRLISPRQLDLSGEHDAVHLREAIVRGLCLMTRNYIDFQPLHRLVLACGGHHFGIVLIRRENNPRIDMTQAQIVRALSNLERAVPDLRDQLVVLNQWR